MRYGVIACSLLALSATLAGCDASTNSQQSGASIEDARWSDATAKQLREAIARRAAHGLDRMRFDVPEGSGDQNALNEVALRYASALARGASDPAKLNSIYSVPRPAPDLKAGLAEAIAKGEVDDWLSGLAPQDGNYKALSKAYLALSKQETGTESAIPDAGKAIEPGSSDPRIPAIARQLVASDYLGRAEADGGSYSPAMVKAVRRMQADYGIKPDGVIGSEALEILNLSDADRARAIAVAMERMRWVDRNPPETRIDVNLASARLAYWRDGKLADTRKVVVGKPGTETPQLGSPIYRLVANPTWTVPRSIQNKEIAGKGAAYLRRNNMAWKDGWIVQQPGPKNSLGLVKFDMQNEHQIYLHDTPAKALFGEVQRQRSHGCVRVEDALGFAAMLAKDEGVIADWDKARATGKETFVPLPRPIPVRLTYQTVLFDEQGEPVIRADPYGWNDRVSAALGFPQSEGHRLRPSGPDMGP
ncbi:murein L,D-transpeptidase YcbB/YkuD [Sphingopyxis sp. OAS728]|uniref:L,D-transpeptidase family protein n=1 Tax=Sphingopyxis sp. OAS728 TaxID=2663823 RepID=UPI00178A1C21|nr:L,D-transpeptidase family protein [Sphingopyxis sp. OAS728]MBE1529718.1 murein L,D-transpeptidase YcbB/YkuD [Sphingopyxis sp. OAS728]